MRRVLAALLLFVLLAPLPGSQLPRPPENRSGMVQARAVAGVKPGTRVGALTLVEAWDLTSEDARLGGFSGLVLTGPRQFLAVSDTGNRLYLSLGAEGRVDAARFAELPPLRPGLARKRYLDAEAITRDARTGTSWVALEGIAQIWRFSREGDREGRVRNSVMYRWPANGGAETLVRLDDGRFLALSERVIRGGRREGVLFAGDPVQPGTSWRRFAYDSGDQGSPTDAAALPDGRLLILHRKLGLYPVFRSSIAIADPRTLASDGTLTGKPIARLDTRLLAENYEGLAVVVEEGATFLWMISDNNQNHWQRSRLVKFRIDPAALADSKKGGTAAGPP